ncbi:cysteine proteinase [Gyrodon lividus]|nr:cysteine proteinase [Gyrodon lividus]
MAPLGVHIKHSGKTYNVQLDPDLPSAVFKDAVYQVTGVPPDRMKVMVKGGVLKDDTDWKKVAPKAGQTFMVIGTAGELPKPPEKPIVFLEDMDESEMAEALAMPVGLKNLGNTCYMNSTVQAMRAIPELQIALSTSSPLDVLPRALRDLYYNMSRTTESVVPTTFLTVLRQVIPQFGEVDRSKSGMMAAYAQQDAEECWSQMINALREVPAINASGSSIAGKKFVDQFLMGEMRRELKCDEASEEPPTVTFERVLKIQCNITISTNYMHTSIVEALNSQLTKNSPTLGRDAVYSQTSRLSRLPSYLTVHMVRFEWRQDVGKKAKIMRKVKFTTEFDASDIATPELKDKLIPVSRRLKEIEKERAERRKVRKRTKNVQQSGAPAAAADGPSMNVDEPAAPAPTTEVPGELEDEGIYRANELRELEALVDPELKADSGCSVTGLYELVAIVTHKGAYADSGHYIGFVKKCVFHGGKSTAASTSEKAFDEDDEDWYKFDDDKVSVFPKEKLGTIDGGGEDSSAYVLLYKTKPLA